MGGHMGCNLEIWVAKSSAPFLSCLSCLKSLLVSYSQGEVGKQWVVGSLGPFPHHPCLPQP